MSTSEQSQTIRAMENEWCAVLIEKLAHRSNEGSADRTLLEGAARVIRMSLPANIRESINTTTLPWHPNFLIQPAP